MQELREYIDEGFFDNVGNEVREYQKILDGIISHYHNAEYDFIDDNESIDWWYDALDKDKYPSDITLIISYNEMKKKQRIEIKRAENSTSHEGSFHIKYKSKRGPHIITNTRYGTAYFISNALSYANAKSLKIDIK